MKLVSIVSGMVAARLIPEEIAPDNRPPSPDYLAAIQNRYSFMARSDGPPGQPILFQNGRAPFENGRVIQFIQLHILRIADIVTAPSTTEANEILNDFLTFIVSEFGFKIDVDKLERHFMSDVIIEFDTEKANVISSLYFIESVIAKHASRPRHLKNLSFGLRQEDPGIDMPSIGGPLAAIRDGDFIIERRLGSDPSLNRFYCRAPLQNEQHLAALQEIEATLSAFS